MGPEESWNGIVSAPSRYSVHETVSRLERILESRGIKLFAIIDHSGEAEKAGLQMPNTKLLIFGSPKAGTPLMLAAPTIAIDLPLKILVWEDAESNVRISYNNPEFLRHCHNLPPGLEQTLAGVAKVVGEVTG